MNTITLNGVRSDTIQGLLIQSLPPISKPPIRVNVEEIDGRNGDIITDLGYQAYDKTFTIGLRGSFDINDVISFFNSEGTVVFSNEPDKYYRYKIYQQIDFERLIRFRVATVTMHVQPFKYPLNESPISVSSLIWEGTDYDQTPYIFRAVSDSSVEVGNREVVEQITGGTVAWNQLCNATSVTITNGHKYYMKKGTAYSIGASTGSAITGLTSGSDMVIDLTQLFGSTIADYIYSLETATAGAGVSLFRSLFPESYYSYNAGELMSVKTSARETTGKNLYPVKKNVTYSNAGINITTDSDGIIYVKGTTTAQVDFCPLTGVSGTGANIFSLLPGTYRIKATGLSGTGLQYIFGGSGSQIPYAGATNDVDVPRTMTSYGATGYNVVRIPSGTTVDTTISIQWEYGDTATSYEPYQKHTYPLSDIELRGIPKLVDNKLVYDGDIYKADGTVTRKYGIRAYQSGDATGGTMITDGTNTVYQLSAETTETITPYTETQICSPYGTESFVDDRDVQIPVGHKTRYEQIDPINVEITNSGNVPSMPTYRIEGSGSIDVNIDGLHAVTADMSNINAITINSEEMNAYNDTGGFANRAVTGSYENLELPVGQNTIEIDGDGVIDLLVTNYERWL